MAKTIYELAKDAYDVQNACNLSGVVLSFAKAIVDLRQHTQGTDATNNHCVSVLWADKIAQLTGIQDLNNERVGKAYQEIYEILGFNKG